VKINLATPYPCHQLMAVSGLRRGEAAGLRWCDIDFPGATLTVSRQLQETGRGLVPLPPKSIAGNRVLALDPWTLQVLPRTATGSRSRRATGTFSPARAAVPTPPDT
jgi:integrase